MRSNPIPDLAAFKAGLVRRSQRPCVSAAFDMFVADQPAELIIRSLCFGGRSARPFFSREGADVIFKRIIRKYAEGLYLPDGPIDRRGWLDLLRNTAGPAINCREVILRKVKLGSDDRLFYYQKKCEALVLKLKVIEDWIYFHRERVLKDITA